MENKNHISDLLYISSKHVSTSHVAKRQDIYLYQIATRIIHTKHTKLFSVHFL